MLAAVNASDPPHASPSDLEGIFQRHHSQVFATAYRMTGSAQDAEDVLQTVFLRLLRRRAELDLSPSPVSYLHRAAVNAALDLMRARSRARQVALDEIDVPLANGHPATSPQRRQEDREMRGALRQAMTQLPPKSAEIFALRFLQDLPNREIALALGMSQTAVGVALHRARNQVKKELHSIVRGDAS
ncbi:MAG TPA: sigma-70 family RNA polymerase sigma factor [Thermoanaerobaculia bacterium]